KNPIQSDNAGFFDVFVSKLDPTGSALLYSTYLGGSGTESGYGIVVDDLRNAYVTGRTISTNYPVVDPLQPSNGGGYDVFVSKLNPAGTVLVYSTYAGGNGEDFGEEIAIDVTMENVYVTGLTASANFPTADPIQPAISGTQDAFVFKLSPLDKKRRGQTLSQ